jgi:hypothetical protein
VLGYQALTRLLLLLLLLQPLHLGLLLLPQMLPVQNHPVVLLHQTAHCASCQLERRQLWLRHQRGQFACWD